MVYRFVVALVIAGFATTATAQTAADAVEWVEEKAPPPPSYSKDKLIPIEMPPYVTLQVGVDPQTIEVGADGVVRYVVVMRNASGSVNVAFEGIQCTQGEVKTYSRVNAAGVWVTVEQPQWRAMTDNMGSRHAYAISQQGGCDGRSAGKREDVIRALKRRQKLYY